MGGKIVRTGVCRACRRVMQISCRELCHTCYRSGDVVRRKYKLMGVRVSKAPDSYRPTAHGYELRTLADPYAEMRERAVRAEHYRAQVEQRGAIVRWGRPANADELIARMQAAGEYHDIPEENETCED